MLFEQARGVTCLENPIVEARFHAAEAVHFIRGGNGEQRDRLREQNLARAQDAEFVAQARVCLFACEFRGAKFARGEVDVGEANRVFCAARRGFSGCWSACSGGCSGGGRRAGACGAAARDGCQKIIFLRFDERACGGRSWREHANHFAAHDFLSGARLLHLLADGYLVAGANQSRDVIFRRVIGNAAHRHGLAFFFVARGERDLQDFRGDHCVVVEKLEKITQAEEQHRRGMLLLRGVILLH